MHRPRRPRGLRRPARRLPPRPGGRAGRHAHRAGDAPARDHAATARPGRCSTDPRFALSAASYAARPDVPEEYRPYLRTMQEQDGPGHLRLRKAVAPAFTPRRVERYRAPHRRARRRAARRHPRRRRCPRPPDGLARPLPMAVICAVLGVPAADRPRWHGYGAMVSAGDGQAFAAAIPAIIDDAKAVLAAPEDGLVTDLIEARRRLTDTEIVTLIWHLVLAGQVPTHLLADGLDALLRHPDQLAALRADPVPARRRGAVALVRPAAAGRAALPERGRRGRRRADRRGRARSTVALGAANRDPRVFADPDVLDVRRDRRTVTSAFLTARTSASAPRSPGWRRRSRSPRCCAGGRTCARRGGPPARPGDVAAHDVHRRPLQQAASSARPGGWQQCHPAATQRQAFTPANPPALTAAFS